MSYSLPNSIVRLKENSLREEWFILIDGFRGFSPSLPGPRYLDRTLHGANVWHRRAILLLLHQKAEEGRAD